MPRLPAPCKPISTARAQVKISTARAQVKICRVKICRVRTCRYTFSPALRLDPAPSRRRFFFAFRVGQGSLCHRTVNCIS
jgi:hypothetical protein